MQTQIMNAIRADPRDLFNDVTLDVIFTQPDGRELRVPAFVKVRVLALYVSR